MMIVELFEVFRKEILSLFCVLSICFSGFLLIKRDYEKEQLELEIKNLIYENKVLNSYIESNK